MKNIFFLLIVFLGCSNFNHKTDVQKLNLNGHVKSVTVVTYKGIEKFGEIVKGSETLQWEKDKHYYFEFNKEGKKIAYQDNSIMNFECRYLYDKKGLLTEVIYMDPNVFKKRHKLIYDDKGLIIDQKCYSLSGEETSDAVYRFDEKGLVDEFNYYNKGKPTGMSIFSAGVSLPNFAAKKHEANREEGLNASTGKSVERERTKSGQICSAT